jgi:squalene monooxygenase
VAAALTELGWNILVVEPGLDASKRLSGELIHPPGVTALAELGLWKSLEQAGGMPMLGFAVFSDSKEACLLPYAEARALPAQGFAIDHVLLRERLLSAIVELPRVSVRSRARISGVDLSDDDKVVVTVATAEHVERISCRLLVAADGVASKISVLAGIRHSRTRVSTTLGFVLRDGRLPHPGFGNVFLGGPAPVLAYQITPDVARVTFDVPDDRNGGRLLGDSRGYLEALPEPFRETVKNLVETQQPICSANYSSVSESVVNGRLVLVGDAAGSCHPLTATGLTVCLHDALRLRNSLRETAGDVRHALRLYARRRRGPQRTRVTLAKVLYDTFKAQTPEMYLLRRGVLRYWECNPQGRAACMALLSTCERRTWVMAAEYSKCVYHGLRELVRGRANQAVTPLREPARVMLGVSRNALKCAGEALRDIKRGV